MSAIEHADVDDSHYNATCTREIVVDEDRALFIAEQHALADEPGACIWDSALVLCNFLIKQHEIGRKLVAGRRVVELGAGTGVVGLTAAALGADHVLLTDKEHLIPHITANIQRNNLSSCATATPLVWGEPLPQEVHPPYDLILCSDVVYNKDMVHQLLHTLKTLSGPDTVMYISSEFRENAGLEQFLELMRDQYQLYAQLVPYTELHEEWCSPDILVWQITTRPLQEQHAQPQQ